MNDLKDVDRDDGNEFAWTQEPFSRDNPLCFGLQELDQNMRCQICCDFFRAPVSIPNCHHTFCSECLSNHVRTGMTSAKRSASCPICRQQILPNAKYIPNRSVEEMVQKFSKIRSTLLNLLRKQNNLENHIDHNDTAEKSAEEKPSTLSKRRQRVTNESSKDSSEEKEKAPPNRIKRLPKGIYHGLKKKQLQKKCQDLGLNIDGDEAQLKARHQEYIRLHNAQCDSFHPRPIADLIDEVHQRERTKRKIARAERLSEIGTEKAHWKHLIKSRGEEGKTVTSGDQAFDAKMNNNFSQMIAQLRAKKMKNKPAQERQEVQENGNASIQLSALPENKARTLKEDDSIEKNNGANELGNSVEKNGIGPAGEHSLADEYVFQKDSIAMPRIPPQNQLSISLDNIESSNDSSVVVVLPPPQHKTAQKNPTTIVANVERSNVIHPSPRANKVSTKQPTIQNCNSKRRLANLSDQNPSKRPKRSIIGPWNCSTCTFTNKNRTWSKARCEMCGTKRTT